jgi:hypothetical protein
MMTVQSSLFKSVALGVSLLLLSVSGFPYAMAQDSLPIGSRVPFTIQNDVTTANMKDKTELQGYVTESVTFKNCEVIPKNALVTLQIDKVKRAHAFGGAGALNIVGAQVRSGDKNYPLNFSYQAKGKSYLGASIPLTIAGVLLTPFFGLGIPLVVTGASLHGKDATMSGGTVRYGLTTAPIGVPCGSE